VIGINVYLFSFSDFIFVIPAGFLARTDQEEIK
jgi:hypothetical protein